MTLILYETLVYLVMYLPGVAPQLKGMLDQDAIHP